MIKLEKILLLISLIFLPLPLITVSSQTRGALIVVTFPNLVDDVKLVASSEDKVVSLVPLGTDPHQYQLTTEDIQLLQTADLIVSTGHTFFEVDIKNKVERKIIKSRLIEIIRISGVEIYDNPALGQPNYHMPIYDPENYKVFILHIAEILAEINPSNAKVYLNRANTIVSKVDYILKTTPRLNVVAAADYPFTQYAVSWLGVKIKYLVVKEAGVSATPADLEKLEEAIKKNEVKLLVVSEPVKLPASKLLKSLAEKYGVPVIKVPTPFSPGSLYSKLKYIAEQASLLVHEINRSSKQQYTSKPLVLNVAAGIVSLSIIVTLFALY
ncbi:MAG TPA: hypothetical protein ENF55_04185, partial [Thermoprotei archaeon]|nr:hypothetical protein [Thermoprotei archaeon]